MWAGWTWKEKPAWVRSSRRRGEAEARTSIGRLLQGERSWRAGWCHGNPGPQKRGTWGTRHPAEKKKKQPQVLRLRWAQKTRPTSFRMTASRSEQWDREARR